jgi:hypothetical protein
MTLRFRREVAVDLRAARLWYEARREGLGDEFVLAVLHQAVSPKRWPGR